MICRQKNRRAGRVAGKRARRRKKPEKAGYDLPAEKQARRAGGREKREKTEKAGEGGL